MSDVRTSSVPGPGELFLRFMQVAVTGFGGVTPWARKELAQTEHIGEFLGVQPAALFDQHPSRLWRNFAEAGDGDLHESEE